MYIGFSNTAYGRQQAEALATKLRAYVQEIQPTPVVSDAQFEALLRGDLDVIVRPLTEVPLEKPETVVIAGLSSRRDPAEWLLVREPGCADAALFKLKAGARIACTHAAQAAQLQEFRPDVDCVLVPNPVMSEGFDAFVCSADDLGAGQADLPGYIKTAFHPREFVPQPGQGVTAWLTHRDNLAVRRLLKQVHHPEVSASTNIERGLLRALNGAAVGIYVEKDASGWFHLWAAGAIKGEFKQIRLSQSTSAGMVEKGVLGFGL